jgi:queuine/archaeosine tRNA-ribosyltransferase
MKVMGDCGAFTYVKEPSPPVTVDEVIRFYQEAGFDIGASVDHIIVQYNLKWDFNIPGIDAVPEDCRARQELTLELARDFRSKCRKDKVCFEPLGIAQGWSPKSYAKAVSALQKMGYTYIALGGMVPLKSMEIMQVLESVKSKLATETRLHLFGVSRLDHIKEFKRHSVVSFDSTSPLTQAFKEDHDNYYGKDRNYSAIRVPQVDINSKLKNRIMSGQIKQREAFRLETGCLEALSLFDKKRYRREKLIELLIEYQKIFGGKRNYAAQYEDILRDKPWKDCECDVCKSLGIHVVIFRGAERNRRRGFHNVYVTHQRLKRIRSRIARAT